MPSLQSIITLTSSFLPLMATSLLIGLMLWGVQRILIGRRPDLGNERLFPRQLAMLVLTLVGVIAIVLALPVSEGFRTQLIGLIGLIISGILAFSSSTIFANLMAGIMLRVTKPFRTGDFISVKSEYFGRVVERGLLDTEIQTDKRELIAFPNTYLITNPVSVVRHSGAIVSTTLSLGYDVHHATIEPLLLSAARECGLEEPFTHVLELGNYAITYKISGMLVDIKNLLTARSNLCRCVLDVLHSNNIEIMSPSFMNQRPLPDNVKIIPPVPDHKPQQTASLAEEVVFDKAEKAEQLENEKQLLQGKIKEYKSKMEDASAQEKDQLQQNIKDSQEQLGLMEQREEETSNEKPANTTVVDLPPAAP